MAKRKPAKKPTEPPRRLPDDTVPDPKPEKEPRQFGGFHHDTDRQMLPGGGVRRGESLQLSEEEDDFTDGRSSGGLQSRSQLDEYGGPDIGRALPPKDAELGIIEVNQNA